jgi:hypothetical protein
MEKYLGPVARAGLLGTAAAVMCAGALAQEAMITAIGAGLSVGGFVLIFRPTLRNLLICLYR